MSLYKVTEELIVLLDEYDSHLNPETGELDPDFYARFSVMACGYEAAADNLAAYIKGLKAEADMIRAEVKEMEEKAQARENKAKRLTVFIGETMNAVGADKIKGARFSIYWQKNPDAVVVERPEALPTVFQRVHVEAKKSDIKTAMETGQLTDEIIGIAGISIVPGAKQVRIK